MFLIPQVGTNVLQSGAIVTTNTYDTWDHWGHIYVLNPTSGDTQVTIGDTFSLNLGRANTYDMWYHWRHIYS